MNDRQYFSRCLAELPGIGSKTICRLLERNEGDRTVLWTAEELFRMPEEELLRHCRERFPGKQAAVVAKRLGEAGRNIFSSCDPRRKKWEAEGGGFCSLEDAEYPVRLRNIPDPPYLLYYRGRLPEEAVPAAAVIGARMASPYGREQACLFASGLAEAGVQVISGLARGIDGIAGRAALRVRGDSFAVLGCGTDQCYPAENRDLYAALEKRGGLLSELPPGTLPRPGFFSARNRIISGLADMVLVVEARENSGTMITVSAALEQGKEVFAVPGRNCDITSRGCNMLLTQGAGAAVHPQQLLEILNRQFMRWRPAGKNEEPEKRNTPEQYAGEIPRTDREEGMVLSVLSPGEGRNSEQILRRLEKINAEEGKNISVSQLSEILVRLAIRGLAEESAPGFYVQSAFYSSERMG